MNDSAPSIPGLSSNDIPPDESAWHPLKGDWFEEVAPEVRDIIRYAQQCLVENKRTNHEIGDALAQLKTWRQANPELVHRDTPELIFDEGLGTQMNPSAFAEFVLAQKSILALKPYEFTALALLKEAAGLAELEVVARKDLLSPVAQHLAIKISRLRTATMLLRMMDNNAEQRESVRTIMASLLKDQSASV